MADGKVIIDTALNNKGFVQGVSGLKGELGGLTSVVKKLGGLIAVAFSAKVLVDFGKASIELGSNVTEVQNVVDVAFGDMSYKIEEFAKTSIQNFGMSRLAAKKTASTYMAMARGMGMADETASNMAVALTGLSGDVASFFNISQELADVKLKSVFTGETETLKDLGVVMTQANLKAYALEHGITKSIDAMSQAELVALRYEFVMDQLRLAHGDFARTSDSWANQTRILSMQWEEFMSIVGQMLITVLKPLVVTLNSIVASMIDTANAVNNVMSALFGGTSTQMQQTQQDASGVGDSIEGSVEDQNDLTDAVEATNKAEKKSLATFDEIKKLTGDTEKAATPEKETPTEKPGGVEDAEKKVEGLSEKMAGLVESIKSALADLKQWLADFWAPFAQSWDQSGSKVIAAAKQAFSSILEMIRSIATAFMNVWSNGTGVTILNTIHSIVAKIFELAGALAERFRIAWDANGNGEAIWQAILNIIQSVLDYVNRLAQATLEWASGLDLEPIVSSFQRLLEAIDPLVSIILDDLAWAYENVLLPLASWVIEDAAPAAIDLITGAIKALTPVIEALEPLGVWLWEEFLQPIGHWTGEVIIAALNGITDALQKFSDWAAENKEDIRAVTVAIFALLSGILMYYVAKRLPDIIEAITLAFKGLSLGIGAITPQALIAATAFALVFKAIMELAKCWNKMDGIYKVVAALGAVVAIAFAAALAVGAFQSALSMGAAAIAIAAGVAAIMLAINGAKAQAESLNRTSFGFGGSKNGGFTSLYALSAANLPHLAQGAVIPANREFLAVLGDQKSGTNVEAPLSTIEQAVENVMSRRGNGGGAPTGDIVLQVDGRTFARLTNPYFAGEQRRVGIKLAGV